MSNSTTPNGIVINGNVAHREGTRVVLREITATLQNSPPIHTGIRKVASPNTPPGKTEHEVKVQFNREFVDAGSPNSRPESLSSASSFQSIASTLSTTSGNQSLPITPQGIAADTSYVNTDIPGLEDLIAACGNIQLTDQLDSVVEEGSNYQSIADSTLTVTANDNSLKEQENNPQNLSQEEDFASVNNSYQLNGTHDLTSEYKEALESSFNLNDTRETVKDKSITNHIPHQPNDNFLLNQTRDLSIQSNNSLNKTTELAYPSEEVENKLPEVQVSNSADNPPALIESSEPVADCNSTFEHLDTNKSDVLNLTHDIVDDKKDSSIDCHSQSAATAVIQSSNESLLNSEADRSVSSLNDPLNLPPESNVREEDHNVSTSNAEAFQTAVNFTTVVKSASKESESIIQTAVKEEISSEQCAPDSSTDHSTQITPGSTDQPSSSLVPEVYVTVNEELLEETKAIEETHQVSDIHNVSTTATIPEEKVNEIKEEKLEEIEPTLSQDITEAAAEAVEPEVSNSTEPDFQNPIVQAETIVPSFPPLNNLQEFGESKSDYVPNVVINVTPFPGENSTLNPESVVSNGSVTFEGESNQTITVKEESFHSIGSEGVTENYNAFQPEKQSTSLNLDSNFLKLELAAQGIAEEIRNKSLEFTEDSDQFFNADSDLFLDGASVDFFLTRNSSKNTVRDLRAESLYVKFDPLVSNVSMLPQGPPQVVDCEENTKNSIPQPKLDTPKRNPAIAAIDRLLMYSPAPPTPNKVEEPPKIEEKIVQDVISEAPPVVDETMAKELELVRATVLQLDSQLDKERKEHEEDLEKERTKYRALELELAREVQKKNEMTMVMDEYEKSLSRHMTDRERERASFEQERSKLQEELQAANHHLGNTEAAFNDVHCKYERLKSVVSAYKSNEDVLKESVQENVETIKTLEARYEQLKSHAMTQLEKANLELEAIRKQHEAETVRLQAMIRKAELKSNSLTEMVAQKSKENKQLSEILDELIARVGQTPE